jgi:hypothetical protein
MARAAVKDAAIVAIMQPYFYPYIAYFALLAAAQTFVIYDCVQFPRRGRVHRTETSRSRAGAHWLTLPLARQSRDTLIRDLRFADGATAEFARRLARQSALGLNLRRLPAAVVSHLTEELVDVPTYLERGLAAVAALLGLAPRIVRSSSLGIDPALRSTDRIIAISKAVGAKAYLNPSGGRALYDSAPFAAAGLDLEFLPIYKGFNRSLLPALASERPSELRKEALALAALREPA